MALPATHLATSVTAARWPASIATAACKPLRSPYTTAARTTAANTMTGHGMRLPMIPITARIPAPLTATIHVSTAGCGQSMSAVCCATFWNRSNSRNRKGPITSSGRAERTSGIAGDSQPVLEASRCTSASSTSGSPRPTRPIHAPACQEASSVLRPPFIAVSSASPRSRPYRQWPAPVVDLVSSSAIDRGMTGRKATTPTPASTRSICGEVTLCSASRASPMTAIAASSVRRGPSNRTAMGARKAVPNTRKAIPPTETVLNSRTSRR